MLCIILILIKISCFFFCGGGAGGGSKPPISCTLHSRLLPIFLTFSISLFLLQNIKQCCILSPYFSHFPPYWNSHLPLFPLPPPIQLFSRAPVLYAPLLYSNVHQEVASKNLKRWKRPTSNSPKWSRSLARTFCYRA